MRGRFLLIASVILAILLVNVGLISAFRPSLSLGTGPTSQGPTFTFEFPPTLVDEEHPSLVCDLPVANRTDHAIRVKEVQTSCGCSKAQLSTTDLSPGAEAKLHLEINLRGRDGPCQITCRLLTDDAATPTWEYEVKTIAMPRIVFAPKSLYLGMMETDSQCTAEVAILLTVPMGVEFPRLKSVKSNSASLTVETLSPRVEEVPGGNRLRIR